MRSISIISVGLTLGFIACGGDFTSDQGGVGGAAGTAGSSATGAGPTSSTGGGGAAGGIATGTTAGPGPITGPGSTGPGSGGGSGAGGSATGGAGGSGGIGGSGGNAGTTGTGGAKDGGSADVRPPDATVDAPKDTAPDVPADRPPQIDASCGVNECGPLLVSDLTALDVSTAPGFDAPAVDASPFRCKVFVVCGTGMTCVYFSMGQTLGSRQSAEATYYDGATAVPAVPVKLWVTRGAQSGCADAFVTFAAGNYVTLTYDGGQARKVYLPAFSGSELTLYASANGSTYRDAALTQLAAAAPGPIAP